MTCCGSAGYYPSFQSCCNETVMLGSGDACCPHTDGMTYIPYHQTYQTCCDGQIIWGSEMTCCGQIPLDVSSQVCCQNDVLVYGDMCCIADDGTITGYYSAYQTCCSGIVVFGAHVSCCGNIFDGYNGYDSTQQACCLQDGYQILVDGDSCCASIGMTFGYFSDSATCCGGSILSGRNLTCCGMLSYNESSQVCCADHIVADGDACCHLNGYFRQLQTCCHGLIDYAGAFSSCCAYKGYDQLVSVCCQDNQIYPGDSCCSMSDGQSQGYFKSNTTCCNGFLDVTGKYSGCCGKYGFNETTQVCCANNAVFLGNRCCGSGSQLVGYSTSTSTCCNGFVGLGANLTCCGSLAFNSSQQVCCDSTRNYVTYGDSCCPLAGGGYQGYYISMQSCCAGKVVNGFNPKCYYRNSMGNLVPIG